MILFDEHLVSVLREAIVKNTEFVDSVSLGASGFGIHFCDTNIVCNERAAARIADATYSWEPAPSTAPWGALVQQTATDVQLTSPNWLRITFASGDYVELETVEGKYESVVVNLPATGDRLNAEYY